MRHLQAVLYLRKSRADDPHELPQDTLRRHEESLRALAERENITLCGVYREIASGDRLAGRYEMQQLLADCESGTFQAVLCMDIDRLGRGSMAEQGYILDTFKRAGIRLITPRKTFDLNDDLDETYSEFESFIARQELKAIKRRLQRGIHKTTIEGGFVSVPPYGYRRATVEGHPSLAPEPLEAEAVRLIFHLYTTGSGGCQQIADTLHDMGYLPRQAARFGRTTILDILRNPVYAGRVVRRPANGRTSVDCLGLHPPLVSEAVFAQAQDIRQRRGHPPTAPRTLQNPLAGIVFCGICGNKLQRLPPSPTRRQESLACPKRGCNTSVALWRVLNALQDALLEKLPATILPSDAVEQPTQTQRQKQVQEQRQRLFSLVEQGVYTPEEYRTRRQALEQQAAKLTPSPHTPPSISNTATLIKTASPARQNQLFKLFFEQILYRKQAGWPPDRFELDVYWR